MKKKHYITVYYQGSPIFPCKLVAEKMELKEGQIIETKFLYEAIIKENAANGRAYISLIGLSKEREN